MRKTKTISIPPALEAEMSKFEENWSSIACRAFEIRIQELKSMNAIDNNQKAIARMKASKMKATDTLYSKGEASGKSHVANRAEYLELERLERWREELRDESDVTLWDVCKAMAGDDGSEKDIYDSLKEFGEDSENESWIQGFLDGALGAFEEIQGQI